MDEQKIVQEIIELCIEYANGLEFSIFPGIEQDKFEKAKSVAQEKLGKIYRFTKKRKFLGLPCSHCGKSERVSPYHSYCRPCRKSISDASRFRVNKRLPKAKNCRVCGSENVLAKALCSKHYQEQYNKKISERRRRAKAQLLIEKLPVRDGYCKKCKVIRLSSNNLNFCDGCVS